jgi:N-acetylglutamate synthase-like GNAT family acetyltransferase
VSDIRVEVKRKYAKAIAGKKGCCCSTAGSCCDTGFSKVTQMITGIALSGVDYVIRQATVKDYPDLAHILSDAGLPTAGVEANLDYFLVAENAQDKEIIAVIGMERSEQYGLLRSLAVRPKWKKQGIAKELVKQAINKAKSNGISELYLLTETAGNYLSRFGFIEIFRTNIPEKLLDKSALNNACACGTCMRLDLSLWKSNHYAGI